MVDEKTVIQLKGVSKRFGTFEVLRGLDLEVRKGETFVVIGKSGVGKSSLLKLIAGLVQPDEGAVEVFGHNVNRLSSEELSELRKRVGVVFQGAALFDSLTVFENVAFRLMRDMRMSEKEAYQVAVQKLELVGLKEEVAVQKPAQLSGGMRKRVGLARAIASGPELILYDEPTSGLDPITSGAIDGLILDMQKKLGVTSVVVTHNMESAYRVANRIGMLYDGNIVGLGTPAEIQESQNPYIHQFVTGNPVGPIPLK